MRDVEIRHGGWTRSSAEIGKAVKLVRDLNLASTGYGTLAEIVSNARASVDAMVRLLGEVGIVVPQKKDAER